MDSLADKMSVKTLEQAIENLPSTLNQLYDDAFRRINGQDGDERDFANKALRWVAYAYRPLTVPELEEALAIEPRGRDFDSDAAPDISLVLEACAGLLIVDKQTKQVRLVHYTAQDYIDTLLLSRYRGAHESIAGDCLTYLNYDVFQLWQSHDDKRRFKARNSKKQRTYCLLTYASRHWAKHYSMAGRDIELGAQLYDFLASNPRIQLTTDGTSIVERPLSPVYLEKTNGIRIAACYGLCEALPRLLQRYEVDINEKGGSDGQSALHLAIMNDEVASAEILLNHGADIECIGVNAQTPLMYAIRKESRKTAWLLVERGADTRAVDEFGAQPFANVRWASPIPFLQHLLDHGADVNSRGQYGTQLTWRVRDGDAETTRWLLGKGAAVDVRDSRGSRGDASIHIAIRYGQCECVELLLANNVDVDEEDQFGHTPLMAAILLGSTKITHLLLDAGAKVDMAGGEGCNALHYAVTQSDTSAIQLLLKYHANCSERSSLNLSLKHHKRFSFPGYGWISGGASRQITFLDARALRNWEPVYHLKHMLDRRGMVYECRVWKGGMNALDIARVRNDIKCIDLLEPLAGSRTKSTTVVFSDYLCELFGFSSVTELEEEFKGREEEEFGEWRRKQEE